MRNSLLFRGIFLVFLFCSFLWVEKCVGQTSILLTSEVKAYLFHVVRKSPILDKNIGYAFEYSGPKVTMKGGAINYDSIDIILLNQPELLFIRTDELANSPKGLLLELCNKTAVWMLKKSLFGLQTGILMCRKMCISITFNSFSITFQRLLCVPRILKA